MELIGICPCPLDLAYQPVELYLPEELPIALLRFAADRHMDTRRAEQHRLGQSDIVALKQTLGRQISKFRETLLAFKVGKQAGVDGLGRRVQGAGHLLQDAGAVEGRVMVPGSKQRIARFRHVLLTLASRGREDLLPQFLGRMSGNGLKVTAIFQQLGQALITSCPGSSPKTSLISSSSSPRVRPLAPRNISRSRSATGVKAASSGSK